MELASQLAAAALGHRRRRVRAIASLLVAIAAVIAGWLMGHSQRQATSPFHVSPSHVEPSSSVLTSHSVLLVGDGSSEGIHITVVLKRQAIEVRAAVDGSAADLQPFKSDAHPGTGFAGALQTPLTSPPLAGVPGGPGGGVTIRLQIHYSDGSRVGTAFVSHFEHGLALR